MIKNDFWNTYFMKRVKVKATGETGTIIDFTPIEEVFIVEMDYPKKEDIYHIRDYNLEELIMLNNVQTLKEVVEKEIERLRECGYEELYNRLIDVPDTYDSFVLGVMIYINYKPEYLDKVMKFLNTSDELTSFDIGEFIFELPGLHQFGTLPNEYRELLRGVSPLIINGNFESPGYNIEPYHNIGACYWIMPIKIKDISKKSGKIDNQDILAEEEISIDQAVFEKFLLPIFKRHFDNKLPENVARGIEYSPVKYNDGIAFDRDLADNFYTYEQIENVLDDINEMVALHKDNYNEFELDFFEQFDKRIRKMMKVGTEKGYKILSVGSP